jgi:hypothetical protein
MTAAQNDDNAQQPDESMNTPDERRRILAEVRQLLAEAKMAHSVSDDESELPMLAMQLDAEQQRLDQLMDTDPLKVIWVGVLDDDA